MFMGQGDKKRVHNFQPQITFVAMETQDNIRKREIRAIESERVKNIIPFLNLTQILFRSFLSLEAMNNDHFSDKLNVYKGIWNPEFKVVFLQGLQDGCSDLQIEDPTPRLELSAAR